MYSGVKFPIHFGDMWREGMKDQDGKWGLRVKSDRAEEIFWKKYIAKLPSNYNPQDHVLQLQEEILSMLEETDQILEIGPGWGNYTFPIARKAKSVSCVDLSRSVLKYVESKASEQGLSNISIVHSKWENYDRAQKVDVLIGINCFYRILKIEEALLKMNNMASRLCIIGVITGPEKPHQLELAQKFGYKGQLVRKDYIHLINILYQMGIGANCKLLDIQKKYTYASEEELWRANGPKEKVSLEEKKIILSIIKKYCTLENEKWVYVHPCRVALLFWKPVKV